MRICGCNLRWGPYNVLLHFFQILIYIPWIEKLDDAVLGHLGISQKNQICSAITKYHNFDNILKTKNGRAMNLVSIHMFSWSMDTMYSNQHFNIYYRAINMQIGTPITKNHTFAIVSKTKNGRAMKSVSMYICVCGQRIQ